MKNIFSFGLICLLSASSHASLIGHVVAQERGAVISVNECSKTLHVVNGAVSCTLSPKILLGEKLFSLSLPAQLTSKSTPLTAEVTHGDSTITLTFSAVKFYSLDLKNLLNPYLNYEVTVEWIQAPEDSIDHS